MTYDPEAVVAEFDEKLTKSVDEGGFGDQYTSDGPLHFKVGNLKDWLRAALLAAHRAGREEAWRKALDIKNNWPPGSFCGGDYEQAWNAALSTVEGRLRAAAIAAAYERAKPELARLAAHDRGEITIQAPELVVLKRRQETSSLIGAVSATITRWNRTKPGKDAIGLEFNELSAKLQSAREAENGHWSPDRKLTMAIAEAQGALFNGYLKNL